MHTQRIYLSLFLKYNFGREILAGIGRYARENALWQMVAYPNLPNPVSGDLPNGLIGMLSRKDAPALDRLRERGVRMVCISGHDPPETIPLVTHEEEAVGRLAADDLIERGFSAFAFAHISLAQMAEGRLAGFQTRLRERGFPEAEVWSERGESLRARLMAAPKPLGVFAANDNRARLVEKECQAAGIAIPSEVGLLGVDNDPVQCELCPVPLSSVIMQFENVGWRAAALLDQLLRGKPVPSTEIRLPPLGIEQRLSNDRLQVEDELVRRAYLRMKHQLDTWSGTDELARELGVSQRLLEKRFRAATHSSIYQELQRMRLDKAARLLRETPLPISEIAARVGLPDINRFGSYFRKTYGTTPRQFRRGA